MESRRRQKQMKSSQAWKLWSQRDQMKNGEGEMKTKETKEGNLKTDNIRGIEERDEEGWK